MTTIINGSENSYVPNPNYSTQRVKVEQEFTIFEFDLGLGDGDLKLLHKSLTKIINEHGDQQKRTTSVKAQMTEWKMHDKYKGFKFISSCIENILKDHYTKISTLDLVTFVATCWGGLYKKGDFTDTHSHEPGFYNFVYYVKAEIDCAPLIFTDADVGSMSRVYYPKTGTGVIFPGYIRHEVPVHTSDTERIMITGNIEATGGVSYPERPFLR
jgi:hypothetical protein